MKKILTLMACAMCIVLSVSAQTSKTGESAKQTKKHRHLFSGDGPRVGMNEYGAGIDYHHSIIDKKVLQNPGVAVPVYTNEHYYSNAFGINQTDHMSLIGGFITANDSKIILGDVINMELAYGHISTNNKSQADRYLFNHGSSWFVLDYELGAGMMTNFNPKQQYGINFVFLRGTLDRSYPTNAGGRANSYTEFRYRYKRILSELTLEGPGFGLGGLKHPEILGLSCKLLQRHTSQSKYIFAQYLGLGMEYMNVNNSYTGGATDHLHMFNLRISCGYIF